MRAIAQADWPGNRLREPEFQRIPEIDRRDRALAPLAVEVAVADAEMSDTLHRHGWRKIPIILIWSNPFTSVDFNDAHCL